MNFVFEEKGRSSLLNNANNLMINPDIKIRELTTVEELQGCVDLQRKVFAMPDLEISPVRHLIVTKFAGGFTLAAFDGEKPVGFVLSVPMFNGGERAFYSHMTAVDKNYQNLGIGAKLKWAQRARSLDAGVEYIKWTFQPVLARNAFFNLERLGATIKTYMPNFYGTGAEANEVNDTILHIESDRLFADWHLNSPKVVALSKGEKYIESGEVLKKIEVPINWNDLVIKDAKTAINEQSRIKKEFQTAFAEGLIVKGFERSETHPKYLLYNNS